MIIKPELTFWMRKVASLQKSFAFLLPKCRCCFFCQSRRSLGSSLTLSLLVLMAGLIFRRVGGEHREVWLFWAPDSTERLSPPHAAVSSRGLRDKLFLPVTQLLTSVQFSLLSKRTSVHTAPAALHSLTRKWNIHAGAAAAGAEVGWVAR